MSIGVNKANGMHMAYAPNMGSILLSIDKTVYQIPMSHIIKLVGNTPELLRAYAQEAEQPGLYTRADLDKMRYDLIASIDLAGKTVMDLGGFDSRYGKAALDHGAARVICVDNHQHTHYYSTPPEHYTGVEYIKCDLMDWTEPVDIMLNFNVLYHIKNIPAFLDKCRRLVNEEMLLMSIFRYHREPMVYVYQPREFNGKDETVYWGYSLSAFERLFFYTGWDSEFQAIDRDRVLYRCKPKTNWEGWHENT